MKNRIIIVLSLFIILFGYNAMSQNELQNQNQILKEGIEISYKWKHTNILSRKSPLKLCITAKNKNNYNVKLSLKIIYYKSGVMQEESDTISKCIKPFKTIRGSKKGMNFSTGSFSNSDIKNSDFSFEIILIEIIKMRSCE